MNDVSSSGSPWAAGVKAARDNALPSLFILVASAALVVSYYHVPAVKGWLDVIGAVNRDHPTLFAMFCTGFTAGFIPWVFRMAFPRLRPARPGLDLLHSVVWWMFLGVVVRYFYALQGYMFGVEPTAEVVAKKVFVDQLGFTVLCGAPFNAISHLWKDSNWDTAKLRSAMGPGWYRRLVLPNLLPNYLVWFPGNIIFYSMPPELQLPVANCIGCFWALMCVRIAAHSRDSASAAMVAHK
jgi:hypothetical protein